MGEAWEQRTNRSISLQHILLISHLMCGCALEKSGRWQSPPWQKSRDTIHSPAGVFALRFSNQSAEPGWTKRVAPCLTPVRNINQRKRRTKAFCPPTPAMRVLLLLLALNAALTIGADDHHRSKRGVMDYITGLIYKGADIVFRSFSEASGYKVTRLPPKATEKSYSEHQANKKSSEKSYSNEKKSHYAT